MPTQQQLQNRETWRTALLSGDYNQAQSVLHDATTEAYCCLGVALDALVDGEWVSDMPSEFEDTDGYRHGGTIIVRMYESLFGTDDEFPRQGDFVNANDTLGKDFTLIAAMIPAPVTESKRPWYRRILGR